ncbi:putative cyclin-dependent serine/threonine-protein kinase DDB_G0272797/DDB_G0274007 isoform X1 [Drosophila montana]|uniref:putative cyclin-dependent serine/threonine-protein kinase DDB_G0272797/DDB_G0274007 isoform X1 n=1 Tax=Drosophila montana TaxID=40370 RepID=UPI00313D05D8
MHVLDLTAALLLALAGYSSAQRVAPGVNPQHYQQVPHQVPQHHQQPPPPQQYQQQGQGAPGVPPQQYVPVQQQQQQVQYQQVPVPQQQQQQQQQIHQQQQMQQPVQQHPQQVPNHQQQAGGHHHGQPQQVLNTGNIQQERAHIQEHMQVPIDTSKMSEAELQFHYFKMHDSDNNNKLDGCELIKSLIHWHEQGSKEQPNGEKPHVEEKVFSDEELVALIDPILQMDDTSHDGFIDYPEFIKAQQKAAEKHQQQQQQQQQPPQQQPTH